MSYIQFVYSDRCYEWDSVKADANLRDHRIPFDAAVRIFDGPTLERPDDREDYGEERTIAIGWIDKRTLVVVYTERDSEAERGPTIRMISARKATRYEREKYFEYLRGEGAA